MSRSLRALGHGRFAAAVVGAVAASLVWLVVVMATATTPQEAKDRRAEPDLPPPTAALRRTTLKQVTWHDCTRSQTTSTVRAVTPPRGYRPVVTFLARAGTPISTGVRVASVAGRPLVAVETAAPFYRDLRPGDRGGDVRALLTALRRAGVSTATGDVLDGATTQRWHERFDPDGPEGVIQGSTLVPVPRGGRVSQVLSAVGRTARPGAGLVEVSAASSSYVCDVPNPTGTITPQRVTFEIGGRTVAVASVSVRRRSGEKPGAVSVVPRARTAEDQARLGILAASSDGPVLAAPLSAVKTEPDGSQSVSVLDGTRRRVVRVSTGATAQGLVEVRGKGLRAGDAVVLLGAARSAAP